MPELREVFEMTTKQMEPDVDAWREQEKRQRRSARNRKIGALAVAAAIGVAALVVVLANRGGQNTTTPAGEPAAVVAGAEEVATGFVEAFGAFDVDRAIAYLADDADLSGLEGGTQNLPSLLSLLEAQGYKQMLTSCDGSGSTASGTDVVCTFDFHGIRSDEIGLGPYSGSSFDLTVRDGQIVRASLYWETGEFSPQMWEPFATWVSKNYPEDAAVMYNGDQTNWLLTEESTRLWGQHTREYVKEVVAGS
jgi:hypothetical protein